MTAPAPSIAAMSHDGNQSTAAFSTNRTSPSTALLIEYYENVANKGSNLPSVRVRVNPYIGESHQQHDPTSFVSPMPTRENTVIDRGRAEIEEGAGFDEQQAPPSGTQGTPEQSRGRQRIRNLSGQPPIGPVEEQGEEMEPLPPQVPRDLADPQSMLRLSSTGSNDIVSSRQFQAIIASAIQELILPEIQAVRNELTAQAQLFHAQPNLNQVSNQATYGTSTSGRKRSRSLTALDAPPHRRNSLSIGTMEGYQAEVVPLPPRPQSPNVPAAMEAESLMRAELRSELKLTPPATPSREAQATASHRLSGATDGPHVVDPSSHTVFTLAEGAYRKRESQQERLAAAKARRDAEKRAQGEDPEEDVLEDPAIICEAMPERTRFSTITADLAESSIHDLFPRLHADRDEITALKSQLDLKQSAADRSGRESDILAQISVLAENTHRSLQQLKDTVLEETNVCVGALSYNIERYVGKVVQGPRAMPGKGNKALGKSASYPQDTRTVEHTGPVGPIKRTTTFLQGIGQALTPAPSRTNRDVRQGVERLENMMERVLDELEMLKRMKQGARRKTNGEMFKGDARSRLNPPEDAVLYIDEARGDAANRERGESEEERMARIEQTAEDYEQEKQKRTIMQDAIATETDIFRRTSKEVGEAPQPASSGIEGYKYPAQPLRMEMGNGQYNPAAVTPVEPPYQPHGAGAESPSDHSYAHGDDEHMFRTQRQAGSESDGAEQQRIAARMSQVQDETRKITIKEPIGLPSAEEAIPSASARESGVLGEHLEGDLGHDPPQSWIDHSSAPPTPISKDEQHRVKPIPLGAGMREVEQKPSTPGPSNETYSGPRRHRSQYFVFDKFGRRQYLLGDTASLVGESDYAADTEKEGIEWASAQAGGPKKSNKGKAPEELSEAASMVRPIPLAEQSPILKEIPMVSPNYTASAQPLPSLFGVTQHLDSTPTKKLKKKFRKPIKTAFEIKESPVPTAEQSPLVRDVDLRYDELNLDSTPDKKGRRSWNLFNRKSQEPEDPATLPQPYSLEPVKLIYPGPSQEVRGRNGFEYTHVSSQSEQRDIMSLEPPRRPTDHVPRTSISDSIKEDAIYNMRLNDELAKGRHPASFIAPDAVQDGTAQLPSDAQQTAQVLRVQVPAPPRRAIETDYMDTIPGPYANRKINRDFTPTPPILDPLPAPHLIPAGLLGGSPYQSTEPPSPQKARSSLPPEDSIYSAAAVRQIFSNGLQRRPTPPRPAVFNARVPRVPSNLPEKSRARRPSTLADQRAQLNEAENSPINGQVSPSKTDASYRTAPDNGEQERADDRVRPPSVYSHDSIAGDRFERSRARTPPDTHSISSADFSSSTRPLDSYPAAPAKFNYSPRNSPRGHLNKPTRVPSGPRVQPPNFSNPKNTLEDRYSRPSFTASDYTRPTTEGTDGGEAIMGTAIKTDLRNAGSVTANWVRTRRPVDETRA